MSSNDNVEIYLMDIRYSDGYNPEKKTSKKREYRYIIDGDEKEKFVVYEEKDELNKDEEK